MRTCLLSSIKPEEMRDADLLWEFCQELAPVSNVKLNETGSTAFIECGPDPDVGPTPTRRVRVGRREEACITPSLKTL